MDHNHQCCCEHKDIKLCKKCGVPYCVDCGKEWYEKCTLNHYWNTYYPYTTTITTSDTVYCSCNHK